MGLPARSGQFAMDSARVLGAAQVIAIDKEPVPAADGANGRATRRSNFEEVDVTVPAAARLTGGRGPDKCIDAVGLEATPRQRAHRRLRPGQAGRTVGDRRPHALRQAILSLPQRRRGLGDRRVRRVCIDKFPLGAFMNRALTLRTGQCHVQRYMRPLLDAHPAG